MGRTPATRTLSQPEHIAHFIIPTSSHHTSDPIGSGASAQASLAYPDDAVV